MDTTEKNIYSQFTGLLYKQSRFGLFAEAVLVAVIGYALWSPRISVTLSYWLMAVLFNMACRFALVETYSHVKNTENFNLWIRLLCISHIATGLIWGVWLGVHIINYVNVYDQALIICTILGISAATNPMFSPIKKAYFSYFIPGFVPMNIWFFYQNNAFFWLGLGALLFIFVMIVTSYFYQKNLYDANLLQYNNRDLVDQLTEAREQLIAKKHNLENSLALIKATLETSNDAIVAIDAGGKITHCNHNFIELWGLPADFLSKEKQILVLLRAIKAKVDRPKKLLENLERIKTDTIEEFYDELHTKTGKILEVFTSPQLIQDKLVGRVWIFRDITNQRNLENELIHQATHDELTNLPNRTIIKERIGQTIEYAKKHNCIFAIVYFDIDRFKLINDSLGHSGGDVLLKTVAKRVRENIREIDTVGRIGGDEFAIIFSSLRNHSEIHRYVKELFDVLGQPLRIFDHDLHFTISAGISFYPKDGDEPETLLKNADTAMYRAKTTHIHGYKFYSSDMNQLTLRRLIVESKLRYALVNDEFYLVYQPIINFKTKKLIGVETLLRWKQKDLGLIGPGEFITIAEETGLIVPIGEWILHQVCEQIKKWQAVGLGNLRVNVNISLEQLANVNFISTLSNIIKKSKIDPQQLELELTESIFMHNFRLMQRNLLAIKSLNLRIALDDFGTGYSCLSYLRRLPINTLKIDKSFVQETLNNSDNESIILAIIAIAKKLHMRVIAEGIETREQYEFLEKHECDDAQGFLISKPILPEEVIAFAAREISI